MTEIQRYTAADASGEIVLQFDAFEVDSEANTPAGGRLVAGDYSPAEHYIDANGTVQPYSEGQRLAKALGPAAPMVRPRWCNASFTWQESASAAEMEVVLAPRLRAQRDALLAACDWTQMPDSPVSDALRAAWRAYRQALRDVSRQAGWPAAVVWPTAPSDV